MLIGTARQNESRTLLPIRLTPGATFDLSAGLTRGRLSYEPGTNLDPMQGAEFVFVLSGRLDVDDLSGMRTTLKTGEAAVLGPHGCHLAGGSEIVGLVRIELPDCRPDGLIMLNHRARMTPYPAPAPEALLGDQTPVATAAIAFEDKAAGVQVGVWASSPYHRKSSPFPRDEFAHLIEGSVTFHGVGDNVETFEAGDTLFIPRGVVIDWEQTVSVRKVFCIVTGRS